MKFYVIHTPSMTYLCRNGRTASWTDYDAARETATAEGDTWTVTTRRPR